MGKRPVFRRRRSSLRVTTRLGSRVAAEGGGRGVESRVDVVSTGASLYLEVVVVNPRDAGTIRNSRLAVCRRRRKADRML